MTAADLHKAAGGSATDHRPLRPCEAFAEARALGLDPEAIAAKALEDAVRAEKARRWLQENSAAIEAQNAWVEQHGLPLAKYRTF